MTNPIAVLHTTREYSTNNRLHDAVMVWCPGCDCLHRMNVSTEGLPDEGHVVWEWNRALDETISFEPSILVHGSVFLHSDGTQCTDWHEDYKTVEHTQGVCHSFLRNGIWDFLTDSRHKLSGQKVLVVPLPDWVIGKE